jgi:hypothetical protein
MAVLLRQMLIIIEHFVVAGKGPAKLCTCRKECNRYDLTVARSVTLIGLS